MLYEVSTRDARSKLDEYKVEMTAVSHYVSCEEYKEGFLSVFLFEQMIISIIWEIYILIVVNSLERQFDEEPNVTLMSVKV